MSSTWLWISAFGIFGVLSRYGLDRLLAPWSENFPLSTWSVNILGSFLAGLIYGWGEREAWSSGFQIALLVGFCGGFTTFSAYTLQVLQMLEKEKILPAITYLIFSPTLGLLGAYCGFWLTRKSLG
ncbi:MAG: CrcB family protein [Pseudobdellovibrionaceae bacterium]